MKCNIAENLMPLALEGRLKGALETNFRAHLSACPSCRETYEGVTGLDMRLAALKEPVPALAPDFTEKVMASLPRSGQKDRVALVARGFAALSFAAFLLALLPLTSGNLIVLLTSGARSLYGMGWGLVSFFNLPLWPVVTAASGVMLWSFALLSLITLREKNRTFVKMEA